MATRSQAEAHRRDLAELVRLAQTDLRVVFDRNTDPEAARDDLLVVMPRLIAVYGSAAATLAADWYDDLRDAEGFRGARFTAAPAELPDEGRAETLVRWGVGGLFAATSDWASAFNQTAGGMQRVIADADRQTITQASTEDNRSPGWEWSSTGAGCGFCIDMAGERTGSEFNSHDACHCIAAPRFTRSPQSWWLGCNKPQEGSQSCPRRPP